MAAYKRKDLFYTRAKEAGYRSRAAYKLLELQKRYRLIERGDRVVDLGAWPGGWLQVAARLSGPRGVIVGVDMQPIEPLGGAVSCIEGDVRDPAVQDELQRLSAGRVDVLLSDMAPKITGVRARDEAQTIELANTALAVAERILKRDGRVLIKIFMTAETSGALAKTRRCFRTVKLNRPEASRRGSAELYLIGVGFKPAHLA